MTEGDILNKYVEKEGVGHSHVLDDVDVDDIVGDANPRSDDFLRKMKQYFIDNPSADDF